MNKKVEDLLVEFEKHWSWMYSKHIAVDELIKEVKDLVIAAVEEERERCAEVADSHLIVYSLKNLHNRKKEDGVKNDVALSIAKAIRNI